MNDNHGAHRAQVLVADDEEDVREFCQDALAGARYGVTAAASARVRKTGSALVGSPEGV